MVPLVYVVLFFPKFITAKIIPRINIFLKKLVSFLKVLLNISRSKISSNLPFSPLFLKEIGEDLDRLMFKRT